MGDRIFQVEDLCSFFLKKIISTFSKKIISFFSKEDDYFFLPNKIISSFFHAFGKWSSWKHLLYKFSISSRFFFFIIIFFTTLVSIRSQPGDFYYFVSKHSSLSEIWCIEVSCDAKIWLSVYRWMYGCFSVLLFQSMVICKAQLYGIKSFWLCWSFKYRVD